MHTVSCKLLNFINPGPYYTLFAPGRSTCVGQVCSVPEVMMIKLMNINFINQNTFILLHTNNYTICNVSVVNTRLFT